MRKILELIYSKVRTLQLNHYFDMTLEKELQKTYVGMNDNFFFRQLRDLVFQSGVRGRSYEPIYAT